VLGMDPMAERVADNVISYHPGVPSVGRAQRTVSTTGGVPVCMFQRRHASVDVIPLTGVALVGTGSASSETVIMGYSKLRRTDPIVSQMTLEAYSPGTGSMSRQDAAAVAGADRMNPLRAGSRRERSRVLAVRVVVVPPLVRRGLRVALGRVFPLLLASKRGDVEIAPGGA
jgi:hypothetical protein